MNVKRTKLTKLAKLTEQIFESAESAKQRNKIKRERYMSLKKAINTWQNGQTPGEVDLYG